MQTKEVKIPTDDTVVLGPTRDWPFRVKLEDYMETARQFELHAEKECTPIHESQVHVQDELRAHPLITRGIDNGGGFMLFTCRCCGYSRLVEREG